MIKLLTFLVLLNTCVSCASSAKTPSAVEKNEDILDRAEANASFGGKRILEVSRSMIANQEVIIGGCWNYISTVYDRAGYSSNQRVTVYKSKLQGPYTTPETIQPGDWLYFINHSYSDIEHSAIFVAWTDEEKKEALMVSYAGENQKKPATYKRFILNNIYNVIRVHD